MNATSADLDVFRAHGHRLLIYQGWNDAVVPPGETINYHDAVVQRDGGNYGSESRSLASQGAVDDSYRLFMIPGMEHCGGGPGPSSFNPLKIIVQWVEQGTAPDAITVSKVVPRKSGAPLLEQRIVCKYPEISRYLAGDINLASSYACVSTSATPERSERQ